ncbi:MAG: DNA recombination protein RmuC [Desulfosarcinaceae bacterium]
MVISWEIAAYALTAMALGLLLGSLVTMRILRKRHRAASRELAHAAALTETGMKQALAEMQARQERTQRDLAASEAKHEALVARAAALEERSGRLPQLERQLAEDRQRLERTESEKSELARRLTAETVRSDAQQRQAEAQIEALGEARTEMKLVFRQLAEEIFAHQSRRLNDQARDGLTPLLAPLQEQLGEFRHRVEAVYDKEVRDRTALKVEVAQLKDLNERIGTEALNLTRALKGDSKVRGQWGELILSRILEEAGLVEGREFETQVSLSDHRNRRFQPDVVVRLPGGKDVVVDAKVSLVAYERYYRSSGDTDREEALKAHLQSVRRHVQDLSAKAYADLDGIRSLDFVLMFIPVEGAFHLVLESAPEIFDQAFEKNIVVVSGTTLMVTLRTIRHAWRDVQQSRNAQAIAREAGLLYDKFVGFAEALELVGKQLDKARQAHRQARERLISGRGNLVTRTHKLLELGVKARKTLPPEVEKIALDDSGIEEAED